MPLDIKGNIISSTDITSVGVFDTHINRESLILHLDADDLNSYPTTGTTWTDLSGRGNHFTLAGTTFSGGTIVFNGTSDYATSGSPIEFENNNPFSLCAWIRSTTVNNQQIIDNENASYRGYGIGINASAILFVTLRNSSSVRVNLASTTTLVANNWYYVCGTYDGNLSTNGMELYINGVREASVTVGANNLTGTTISGLTTSIGRRVPATQGLFNGNIAVAQIYSRALSSYEIAENFQATRGRFGV